MPIRYKLSNSALKKANYILNSSNSGNVRIEDNFLVVDDGEKECGFFLGEDIVSPLEKEEKAHEVGKSIRLPKELIELACYTII